MRKPTNWDHYQTNPNSLISRYLFLNFVTRAYQDLLKEIEFKKPITIIEFGGATGYINAFLDKIMPVKKITLIDFNDKMLRIAKETLAHSTAQTELIKADFFKFKVKEKYDLVHSQGVIEHFEPQRRRQLLKQHYLATKKGGYCIVYFPTPTLAYRLARKTAELLGLWPFTDETPLKETTVVAAMEKLGFQTIKSNQFLSFFLTEIGVLFKKP